MSSFTQKLKKLREVAKAHSDWLLASILGDDVLTEAELKQIATLTSLPKTKPLNYIQRAYLIGKAKALLPKVKFGALSLNDLRSKDITTLDTLAIAQAEIICAKTIKNLTDDITAGVFSDLQASIGSTVTEILIQDAVQDETKQALIHGKTAKQLAAAITARLKDSSSRDWNRVASTELSAAKNAGYAQAIAQKLGPFKSSKGLDARVSVVTRSSRCLDCEEKYLDKNGNPRIFILRDLLANGSNASNGVSHKKLDGLHIHWKATVPPMHPSCFCELKFLPEGTGWVDGKLHVINKSIFDENIFKAKYGGVQGSISATVKPAGPPGAPDAEVKIPSMDGVQSINQGTAATGTTGDKPAGAPGDKPAGAANAMLACPFGGGAMCVTAGGDDAETHKPGGESAINHQKFFSKHGKEAPAQEGDVSAEARSEQWDTQNKSEDETLRTLQNNEVDYYSRSKAVQGYNASFVVALRDGGQGFAKTVTAYPDWSTDKAGAGIGAVPRNSQPAREAAAFTLSKSLGLNVPPTVTRDWRGAPYSFQKFQKDYVTLQTWINSEQEQVFSASKFIKSLPVEARPAADTQLRSLATFDLITNNNDRHPGNFMCNADASDIVPIDHGLTFGNSFDGHHNEVLHTYNVGAKKFKVPEVMQKRLKSMSYGDFKRALKGSDIEEWSVAQTFLRSRYVTSLQDTHGSINPALFRETQARADGVSKAALFTKSWGGSRAKADRLFDEDEKSGNLPTQQFNAFCKAFMARAASDESHPDHAAALDIQDTNPFMGPGFWKDDAVYRRSGAADAYEKTLDQGYDLDTMQVIPRKSVAKSMDAQPLTLWVNT